MIGRNRTAPSAGHLFGLCTLQRPLNSQVHLVWPPLHLVLARLMTQSTWYVVCHRSFSHPPLFSISFVGATSFQRTQLYVGFGFQMKRGFFGFILRPPKLVRMCVRVRICVHVTGGVLARGLTYVGRLSEQPHWRWPNQGAAVAKQGGLAS